MVSHAADVLLPGGRARVSNVRPESPPKRGRNAADGASIAKTLAGDRPIIRRRLARGAGRRRSAICRTRPGACRQRCRGFAAARRHYLSRPRRRRSNRTARFLPRHGVFQQRARARAGSRDPSDVSRAAPVLKPGGLAVHSVNCGDHYAYFDRARNPVEYLTYSENEWSFWNNDLLYQNRLRPSDFLNMARAAGLALPLIEFRPKPALLEKLPSLKIDPRFAAYPPAELCCTSIDFVARRE